jgi:hypothetical protein
MAVKTPSEKKVIKNVQSVCRHEVCSPVRMFKWLQRVVRVPVAAQVAHNKYCAMFVQLKMSYNERMLYQQCIF